MERLAVLEILQGHTIKVHNVSVPSFRVDQGMILTLFDPTEEGIKSAFELMEKRINRKDTYSMFLFKMDIEKDWNDDRLLQSAINHMNRGRGKWLYRKK